MSRIGKKPVPVGTAKVTIKDRHGLGEGPKGQLAQNISALDAPETTSHRRSSVGVAESSAAAA